MVLFRLYLDYDIFRTSRIWVEISNLGAEFQGHFSVHLITRLNHILGKVHVLGTQSIVGRQCQSTGKEADEMVLNSFASLHNISFDVTIFFIAPAPKLQICSIHPPHPPPPHPTPWIRSTVTQWNESVYVVGWSSGLVYFTSWDYKYELYDRHNIDSEDDFCTGCETSIINNNSPPQD